MKRETIGKIAVVILGGHFFLFYPTRTRSECWAAHATRTYPSILIGNMPGSYEDVEKLFDDIFARLKLHQKNIEKHTWLMSTKDDLATLDSLQQFIDAEYKKFPDPEQWYTPTKKIEAWQIYRLRDKAHTVMFQFVNLRALLAARRSEVQQKILNDQLNTQKDDLESLTKNLALAGGVGNENRLWYGGILFTILLFGALGYRAYYDLLKNSASPKPMKELSEEDRFSLAQSLNALGADVSKIIAEIQRLSNKSITEETKTQKPEEMKAMPTNNLAPKKTPLDDLLELYNSVARTGGNSGDFWQRYKSDITPIGIINAEERIGNDKIPPTFGPATNGEFYAVKLSPNGETAYVVVPKFGLNLSEAKYLRGGWSNIFLCNEEDLKRRGSTIVVNTPAIFKPDAQLQIWNLVDLGEISLEQGG